MATGKVLDVRQTVGYLTANGIKILELRRRLNPFGDILHYGFETFEGFGRLREQADIAGKVQHAGLLGRFYHDSTAARLPYQTEHFGMTTLTIYHDLWRISSICYALDTALQLQYHWAGGIYQLYAATLRLCVGRGWFAVCAKQYLASTGQGGKLLVVYGLQSHSTQAIALATIVHDIAQAIQHTVFAQFLLGLADRCGHTEAIT